MHPFVLAMGAVLVAVAFGALGAAGGAADSAFPFVIPTDGLVEGTAPADLATLSSPAGAEGFVGVRGERFVLSDTGQPIRFWATNLCFGGCFPPHDVADRMARRLASLGINCVRFHHMDAHGFPRGIWQGSGASGMVHGELHPGALDRLDYLIARLKEHGVYANLNLHVSREYAEADGFPAVGEGESVPSFGKGIDHFFPRAVDEQKRYARMLLTHVNPHTGNAYAQEPAVAMVEISNEDGLLHQWQGGRLGNVPGAYVDELERQWNAWLAGRYGSTDALRTVWAEGEVAGSDEDMLKAPGVRSALATHEGARARIEQDSTPAGRPAQTVVVEHANSTAWHVQYPWGPIAVTDGATYRLAMRLRANRQETISVNCMMNHEPWQNLGLSRQFEVGPQWSEHEFYFVASAGDAPDADGRGGARVTLTGLSKPGLLVSFADVRLCRAQIRGLLPEEQLANGRVGWPRKSTLASRTVAVRREVVRFLRDIESSYWQGMREYLHDDLGVRMPVTGTAVGFTSPHIAAETADFVDSHAYWRHPHFPGRPWDSENWIVRNDPMVNDPDHSTIATLAGRRVAGLPYTVTEYNHPSPHLYEAEGHPLISAYGAFQRWDGVFNFAYSHNDRWETDRFNSFFDIKANPVKLAAMPACSALFRSGALAAKSSMLTADLTLDDRIDLLLARGPGAVNAYAGGVDRLAWQRAPIGVSMGSGDQGVSTDGDGDVRWELAADGRGVVTYTGSTCAGAIGFCVGRAVEAGTITVTPGDTSLDGFSVLMVNTVDGEDLDQTGRLFITALTRCYNEGMGWNAEHNSVGRQWGRGPTVCEGVPLSIRVRHAASARLFALKPDGSRGAELSGASDESGITEFSAGPRCRTLWYELLIER